jgi:hypothetical protein
MSEEAKQMVEQQIRFSERLAEELYDVSANEYLTIHDILDALASSGLQLTTSKVVRQGTNWVDLPALAYIVQLHKKPA